MQFSSIPWRSIEMIENNYYNDSYEEHTAMDLNN